MTHADAQRWLNQTHVGDCRQLLRQMSVDGVRVQMCVTSPPYFRLRSYLPDDHPDKRLEIGRETTPEQYIKHLVEVFRGVRNVLSDDGTLWVVMGDTYAARRTRQASNTRGGPKHAPAQAASGPMRPPPGCKPKDLIGIPWMLAFALRDDGWYLRADIIWAKRNVMPESVTDRCTRAHEYLFLFAVRSRYYFDHVSIREPAVALRGPGNKRPVRIPPGERTGTNANLRGNLHRIGPHTMRNRRDVWTIASRPSKGNHFAVFPDALIAPCILAGSRAGDVVLDPFMGSGTVAEAAVRLDRRFIGCELNRAYVDPQPLP